MRICRHCVQIKITESGTRVNTTQSSLHITKKKSSFSAKSCTTPQWCEVRNVDSKKDGKSRVILMPKPSAALLGLVAIFIMYIKKKDQESV